MRTTTLIASLALLALASTASAQIIAPPPVTFTGVVEAAAFEGDIICAPPTHQLACTGGTFFLYSNAVDLDQYIGQNVRLHAIQVNKGCPLYRVPSVESPAPTSLTVCGTPGFGCPVRVTSSPGGISQHMLFASAVPGFWNVSYFTGVFMLSEPFLVVGNVTGTLPPEGAHFDFNLPSFGPLVGVPIYLQAARRDVGPVGEWRLSNPQCITIVGHTLLCIDPTTCF